MLGVFVGLRAPVRPGVAEVMLCQGGGGMDGLRPASSDLVHLATVGVHSVFIHRRRSLEECIEHHSGFRAAHALYRVQPAQHTL